RAHPATHRRAWTASECSRHRCWLTGGLRPDAHIEHDAGGRAGYRSAHLWNNRTGILRDCDPRLSGACVASGAHGSDSGAAGPLAEGEGTVRERARARARVGHSLKEGVVRYQTLPDGNAVTRRTNVSVVRYQTCT